MRSMKKHLQFHNEKIPNLFDKVESKFVNETTK